MKSFLALSLLTGCTAGNVYHVDSRFTAEESAAISAANDMWCTASRNALCMDLVFGARVDVSETGKNAIVKAGGRAIQYRFPDVLERRTAAAFYHPGNAIESKLIVVLSDRVPLEQLRVAVAHEMGHSFGAGDVNDPAAIMHHNLSGAADKEVVTCADLVAAGVSCDQDK